MLMGVPLMGENARWQGFDAGKGAQSEERGNKKGDSGRDIQVRVSSTCTMRVGVCCSLVVSARVVM